jgi:hypothetical protein
METLSLGKKILETLFWAEYRATTWPRVGKNCQMII